MEVVNLPILSASTPLRDAIRAMRIQHRSAVLRETPAQLDLIKVRKIFGALGQQSTELSDVTISEPVYRLSPAEISAWKVDMKDPRSTWAEWESFLDLVGHSYALIDSYFGSALMVTRHEGQKGAIVQSAAGCYCLGPDEHSIPDEATIVPVQICSVCSFSVLCA